MGLHPLYILYYAAKASHLKKRQEMKKRFVEAKARLEAAKHLMDGDPELSVLVVDMKQLYIDNVVLSREWKFVYAYWTRIINKSQK
jgi:hypothetical protein